MYFQPSPWLPRATRRAAAAAVLLGWARAKKVGEKINETQKLKEKGREWREKAINQRINFHFLLSSLRLFSVHWLACRRWERSLGTLTLRRCAECRGSQRAMSWWGAKNLENYTEMLLMGSFEEGREREHRYCWGGWVEGRIFDMPAGAHVVINNKSVPKRFVMEASRQQGVRCQQRTTKLCYWKLIKWFSYPFFHRCWSLLDCVPPNALSLSLSPWCFNVIILRKLFNCFKLNKSKKESEQERPARREKGKVLLVLELEI